MKVYESVCLRKNNPGTKTKKSVFEVVWEFRYFQSGQSLTRLMKLVWCRRGGGGGMDLLNK